MAKISEMQGAVNTGKQIGKIVSSLIDVLTDVAKSYQAREWANQQKS